MHQAMATGLPKIMDELNAIINDIAIKVKLYPEAQMRRVVMELYTRIFDLLARLMKWYTKNHHLWKLMKKDCYADFEMALRDIRNWAQIVNNGAWNNFVLESRRANTEARDAREVERIAQERYMEDTLQIAVDYYETKENAATQQAIQQAQRELSSPEAHVQVLADALVNRIFQRVEDVGAGQAYILASSASSMAVNTVQSPMITPILGTLHSRPSYAKDVVTLGPGSTTSMNYDPSSPAQDIGIGARLARLQTKEEVEHRSRRFDEWYPEGRLLPVQYSQAPANRPTLHESIASRLLQWMKAAESKVLCIQLPYDPTPGSVGSQIAAHVVSSAYDVDYPIISYFCTLPRIVAEGRSAQTTALCEMVACLMRQLVMALPETLPETSPVVLTAARFDCIVGTLKTWESMIDLFADLLSLITTSMLIVIHGMQCLNSEHTTSPIQNFLAVLRKRLDRKVDTAGHTTKVLFVMEGQARAVVPWLQRWEHTLYDGDQRLSR